MAKVVKTVRVDEPLWNEIVAKATRDGVKTNTLVVSLLEKAVGRVTPVHVNGVQIGPVAAPPGSRLKAKVGPSKWKL